MIHEEKRVGLMKKQNKVRGLFPDELKEYMDNSQEGTYTLLDVRQPYEYEESHLPGARLIPLPKLADSLSELDEGKPTIVYCAVGGRSRTAAQLLMHQGFADVFHLEGGIDAWEEPTATGPVEFHLRFVRGDETPAEVIRLAYQMEQGLKGFHEAVLARTDDEKLAGLLGSLIKAEEKHMRTLLDLSSVDAQWRQELSDLVERDESDLMESGVSVREFLTANERFLHNVSGYMELAMMVETQALDLYLRMAGESQSEPTRKVLLTIAEEEKSHLGILGRYMDQLGVGR